jgi:hypothetical protein
MKDCVGCGLCELIASRISKDTLSYSDSFIQIRKAVSGKPHFKAVIDYGQRTDYREIRDACPGKCFDITNN